MGKLTISNELMALTSFVADLKYEDLPQDVISQAKSVLSDSVGVIIAGMREPEVKKLAEKMAEIYQGLSIEARGTTLVIAADTTSHFGQFRVDPNFENSFILNRTFDDGKGYLNIYEDQYSKAGPGLHGLALDNGNIVVSSETAWGVNLIQHLPSVPFTIFMDVAGATDISDSYLDAGLSFEFGPLTFHIPLYQSWDENTMPNNKDWIKDRIRFEIDFSRFSFGIGG